jgi:1-phosphofructokinase
VENKLIYCILTNPAVDVVYSLDEIRPGSTTTGVKSRIAPAGKGINVARIIKKLGEEVCVIGIIQANNRDQFHDYLRNAGILSHWVVVEGTTRVNVTLLEAKTGQTTHVSSLQAPISSDVQLEAQELINSYVANEADACIFAGSLPDGIGNEYYQKVIRSSKEKGAFCLLDTSGDPLKFGIQAKPHMIKPNLEELEEFFGESIQGVHHIALKGKRLVDMGIEYVFISLGSDGMIAIHENDCLLCSAPQVRAVDTVGCGDALVAGLITGYCRKFSFTEMCRMAVACGSSKALHSEAGVIDRNEVWQLMEDVKIKSV